MSQVFRTLRFRKSNKNNTFSHDGQDTSDEHERNMAAESLKEGETCSIVLPSTKNDPKVIELDSVLKDWVNETLASERIIVKDLRDDLYDGQVLQKLFEALTSQKLNISDIRQAEAGQKRKLDEILKKVDTWLEIDIAGKFDNTITSILQRFLGGTSKWSMESIHSKNYVAILHLLVALAIKSRANIRLPEHVSMTVFVMKKENNSVREVIFLRIVFPTGDIPD